MMLCWTNVGPHVGSHMLGKMLGCWGGGCGAIEALTKLLAQQHADHVAAQAQQRTDHQAELEQVRADHAAELERIRDELERTRQDADRQDRLHREQRAEVEHLLKALVERVEADQARLIEERDHLRDELQEARAEADQAKADQVRMAQDVAGMFDELDLGRAARRPSTAGSRAGARTPGRGSAACRPSPNWSGFGMSWIAPARMPAYGVKRPTASAPASPTCRPTPNIPSGRWHGSGPSWNRRGGRGGTG